MYQTFNFASLPPETSHIYLKKQVHFRHLDFQVFSLHLSVMRKFGIDLQYFIIRSLSINNQILDIRRKVFWIQIGLSLIFSLMVLIHTTSPSCSLLSRSIGKMWKLKKRWKSVLNLIPDSSHKPHFFEPLMERTISGTQL